MTFLDEWRKTGLVVSGDVQQVVRLVAFTGCSLVVANIPSFLGHFGIHTNLLIDGTLDAADVVAAYKVLAPGFKSVLRDFRVGGQEEDIK